MLDAAVEIFRLGHYRQYESMFLLVVAQNSDITFTLEELLIDIYQKRVDLLLQNLKKDAKGSKAGSPHFLYVCFAARDDACSRLIRRRRG